MHYWDIVDPYWEEFDIYRQKNYLKVIKNFPQPVVHLTAAHWCMSEVRNGGLHQFYLNPTGIVAPEAVIGFAKIRMDKTSRLLERSMLFFNKPYPRSRVKRTELLDAFAIHSGSEFRREADPFFMLDEIFMDLLETEFSGFQVAASLYASEISTTLPAKPPRLS